jgi:hypothetical protein
MMIAILIPQHCMITIPLPYCNENVESSELDIPLDILLDLRVVCQYLVLKSAVLRN